MRFFPSLFLVLYVCHWFEMKKKLPHGNFNSNEMCMRMWSLNFRMSYLCYFIYTENKFFDDRTEPMQWKWKANKANIAVECCSAGPLPNFDRFHTIEITFVLLAEKLSMINIKSHLCYNTVWCVLWNKIQCMRNIISCYGKIKCLGIKWNQVLNQMTHEYYYF